MKKAYRQNYSWAAGKSAKRYEAFLKKHILQAKPNFYGIIKKSKVDTVDGVMLELHLTTTVDDPSLDIIAECMLNNQRIYLWRDIAWALAQDEHQRLLHASIANEHDFAAQLTAAAVMPTTDNRAFDKIITIYPIGRNLVD